MSRAATASKIDNGIGDGFDHVAIVVRAAQALRRQHIGAHHHHVGELVEIELSHIIFVIIAGKLDLLIAGDMRIA